MLRRRITLCFLLLLLPLAAAAYQHGAPALISHPDMQTRMPSGTIVIKFSEESGITVTDSGLETAVGHAVELEERLSALASGVRLERRFTRPAAELNTERLRAEALYGGALPDLNSYAQLRGAAPAGDRDALLMMLRAILAEPSVESAWLEPVAVPAALGFDAFTGNYTPQAPVAAPSFTGDRDTPDFTGLQGYLNDAPEGVGAWSVAGNVGADGATVKVVDVEGAWLYAHEDLPDPFAEIGTQTDNLSWRNHGTAVLGEIRGTENAYGVRGITPATEVGGASVFGMSVADAINQASAALAPGDIILIELHGPGPNANGEGQFGYVCMEYWQDNFDAMLLACLTGRIVCEAAGNGAQDFDDPVYEGLFDRNVRDSGAIMCGASNGSDLTPAWFSNHGSRLDLHGWGYDVVTCGYGGLQGEPLPEEEWYTSGFSGTSSASPIVVGSVASLQGMAKDLYGFPLDARLARHILRATGTPQEGEELIGPRPNLVDAWAMAQTGIGRVEGHVYDAVNLDPLPGIRVDVPEFGGFVISDGGGAYALPLPAGDYTLVASDFFHVETSAPISIVGDVTTTQDLYLTPKDTYDIDGYLFNTALQPLADVRVTASEGPLAFVETDADGYFVIEGVPTDFNPPLTCDHLPGYGVAHKLFSNMGIPGDISNRAYLAYVTEDFETGDGGFTSDGNGWDWGAPVIGGPLGGFGDDHCWGVGMDGDYGDDQHAIVESPSLDLSGMNYAFLSLHYWSATEAGFDGVNLELWVEGEWLVIEPSTDYTDPLLGGLDGEPGWSGYTEDWVGALFNLSSYVSADFRYRFVFGSDGGVTGEGFWIDAIALDAYDVSAAAEATPPVAMTLAQNHPNPFNPMTEIEFSLARASVVDLRIFDPRGRLVRTLLSGEVMEAGTRSVVWHGKDDVGKQLASGIYLYRLEGVGETHQRKMLLLE